MGLDQITNAQIGITANPKIPYTIINAVPGPPTPAQCTDTFVRYVAIIIPVVTVTYARERTTNT